MRTTEDYVLAMAKSQGRIARLMLHYSGESQEKRWSLQNLLNEIEALKQVFLQDDPLLQARINNIKNTGKFHTGSCYTDPFGWGFPPVGGWPASKGGVMYMNDDLTDQKKLPFGMKHVKRIPLRGESLPFSECWVTKTAEDLSREKREKGICERITQQLRLRAETEQKRGIKTQTKRRAQKKKKYSLEMIETEAD